MKNTVWVSSIKSNLHCGMDYLLFISMNNENYIKLSIADTVIRDYDNYASNWNLPQLNYCECFYRN